MSLKDLNEELYRQDSEIEKRKHEESRFNPSVSEHAGAEKFQEKKTWGIFGVKLAANQKKALKIAGAIIAAIFFLSIVFVTVSKFKQTAFSDDRVAIEIEGPKEVGSNQLVEYKIKYKNNNRASLKNAEILLSHTENFQPENNNNLKPSGEGKNNIYIGKIESHGQGEVSIKGKFYAPESSGIYFNAELKYTPSNFNSVFQAKSQLGIEIKSSPIFLSLNAPQEASKNGVVEYVINYENSSDRHFKNLILKAEYPQKFNFQEAVPRPSKDNNSWYLGDLKTGQKGEIKIRGRLDGFRDEGRVIKVSLGLSQGGRLILYNEKEKTTKIVASPIFISQTVNGSKDIAVNQGEVLNYALTYRNEGDIGLRDAIVTVEIKSSILDFSKLVLRNGAYDSSKGVITWKAGRDIPELEQLEAGEEGRIEFSIPVKNKIDISGENDKNFVTELTAKVDSPDISTYLGAERMIASDKMAIKLNSKVILETKGYYNDSNITNTGPLPPRVGKETSYAIHWLVTNISNDISDAKVEAALPTWARWKNEIYPKDENVQFNPRTNKIVWNIGSLGSGTGILDHPKEVSFRVSVVPEINQMGDYIEILSDSTLTAKDEFTSKEIEEKTAAKNSMLREDMSIDSGMYKVADIGEE
ncbi:hypothetical protein J7J13_03405 [bacterium]|nr:hypothetical protein [bacterium]